MVLLFVILVVSGYVSIANCGNLRTLRSTPNDQTLCDGLSNLYSEFILKEAVIIGPNNQPLIDGLVLNFLHV